MSIIKNCDNCDNCDYINFMISEYPCNNCNNYNNHSRQEQKPNIKEYCSNCRNIDIDKCCYKCHDHSEFKDKNVSKIDVDLENKNTAFSNKLKCDDCKYRDLELTEYPCIECGNYTQYEYKKYELEIKENCSSCKYKETNLYLNPCAHCREHSKYEYKKYELKTNSVPKPYKGVIVTPDEIINCGCCKYTELKYTENPCNDCHRHSKHTFKTNEKQKPLFSELVIAIESYNEQQISEINSDISKVDEIESCDNCLYKDTPKTPLGICPGNECYKYLFSRWEPVYSKKNDTTITKTEFQNKTIPGQLWEIYELILKQNKRDDDKYILKRG